ncbi:MAG: DUF4442 domain-containing protein [Bacteroidota bacterium]
MSIYRKLAEIGPRYVAKHKLFKYGFNWSPMYRRTTARLQEVSKDLMYIRTRLPLSYKNSNYVGTIFGGSMFAAVDPFPMTQLINLIGKDYVVWDKSAEINFKRPADVDLYAEFTYTQEELEDIVQRVAKEQEIEIVKETLLKDKSGETVYCQVLKTIYIADKAFFKKKQAARKSN